MALKLPSPPWQSASWQGAPSCLDDVIAGLSEQRQVRELALQLRLGLKNAQAEFSYLRVKGLKELTATLGECVSNPKWLRRFATTQEDPDLQIIRCVFAHSLAPPLRSTPPSPSDSPGRVSIELAVRLSPPGEEEVLAALLLLQGCCLADAGCRQQASKIGGVKALVERLLGATAAPVRGACLDALLPLLLNSPENLQEFVRLGALKQITDLVRNTHVPMEGRVKTLEFLAVLLEDDSGTAVRSTEGAAIQAVDLEEEVRVKLGEGVVHQLREAIKHGTVSEGGLESLAQDILLEGLE